jgi:HEAT repeat protein
MSHEYPSPVSQLLTYGTADAGKWPDYLQQRLALEHVPDLIRMATDTELYGAESDSLEVWAPVHAWRALGQLQAEEGILPLMNLFHEQNENEWVTEELPEVYAMIGPPAIPALERYLSDAAHGLWPQVAASRSLEEIGKRHPEAREECVAALVGQLEQTTENDPTLNGTLIYALFRLNAVETLPLIRKAFEEECVDEFIMGNLESVEKEFALQGGAAAKVTVKKVGRNEPCPCGSGKKYKKCCLGKERAA